MTAIVGWIDHKNDDVWIGADSAASSEYSIINRLDPKVFYNGPFLIGGSGSYRCLQLLMYDAPGSRNQIGKLRPPKRRDLLYKFMVMSFIPCVRNIFHYNGVVNQNDEEFMSGSLMVAINSRIFVIDSDFQVGEHENFSAIGSGEHTCLGALKICYDHGYDPEEGIKKTLEASACFCNSVRGPYKIYKAKKNGIQKKN